MSLITKSLAYDLEHLSADAHALWQARSMTADLDDSTLGASLADVLAEAQRQHCTTVAELLASATAITEAVAGAPLNRFTDADTSRRLHQARNAIGALAAAASLLTGDDPAAALSLLPAAHQRFATKGHPLADDQVLMCRHIAEHDTRARSSRWDRAMVYALAEAGMHASETTTLTPRDFDHPRHPTTVIAPGVHQRAKERILVLPEWSKRIIAIGLDRHLSSDVEAIGTRITYTGRKPGTNAASASANGVLARVLDDARVSEPSHTRNTSTPGGVPAWRALKTYEKHDLPAAMQLSGKSSEATLAFICVSLEAAIERRPPAASFRGV